MLLVVVGMATPTASRTLRGISFQFVHISQKHRRYVGYVKRSGYLLPGARSLCPAHPFANRQREEDRATYRGAMDHADKAKVRSAVGLKVDAGWVMDVVDAIGGSWDGDPDRFTYPTGDNLPACPHFAKAS